MLGDNPFVNTVIIRGLKLLLRKKKLFFAFFLFWSLASFAHAVPVITQHEDSANILQLLQLKSWLNLLIIIFYWLKCFPNAVVFLLKPTTLLLQILF